MNFAATSIRRIVFAALVWAAQVSVASDSPATAPIAQGPATAPTTAPTTAPVESRSVLPATQSAASALIDELSNNDPRERRHAAEQLVRMGEDARPLLEDLLKRAHDDVDVIARAQAALEQIEEDRMVGPSYVTLHFKNAPASSIAAELTRQAFASLQTFPDNLWDDASIPKVSIDVDHQPFWVAMRQFSEQTGVELQPYIDGVRLMHTQRRPGGIAVVQGPFLIVATQISRTEMIQLGPNGMERSDFSLQMSAYPEPKLVVVQGGTMEIQEAVDDKGNSLLGAATERRVFVGGGNGVWQMYTRLAWPPHPGKRIARLVCSTSFVLQTKSQKLDIADILNAKPQTQTLGGSAISFKGIRRNGQLWELQLSAGNAAPFQQMAQNRLQLFDAQGKALERRGMSGQGDGGQLTFKLLFTTARRMNNDPTGDPARLVWEVPVETKSVPLQFEFHDLPMPD